MSAEGHVGAAYALSVAYDGAGFAGFARQPGLETVQGRIETALSTILREPIETVGAGRTDAGVHALGQVVSFTTRGVIDDTRALLRSLDALTGPGIVVNGVRAVRTDFSARFDAISREYRYRLVPGPVPPAFIGPFSWWVRSTLDLGAMREAALGLIGEHDFRSFCVAESATGRSTVRALEVVEVTPALELGEHCVVVRVVGNAFLHSMVRVIVGSLVEVGVGRRPAAWMAEVVAASERSAAGPTAPARGLTLWHVAYPEECWL